MSESKSYELVCDPSLAMSWGEKEEARKRMGQYGSWSRDERWWTPNRSCVDVEKKIHREGFIILHRRLK